MSDEERKLSRIGNWAETCIGITDFVANVCTLHALLLFCKCVLYEYLIVTLID